MAKFTLVLNTGLGHFIFKKKFIRTLYKICAIQATKIIGSFESILYKRDTSSTHLTMCCTREAYDHNMRESTAQLNNIISKYF